MDNSTLGKVKCQDCGFLSMRHKFTRELIEVEAMVRETGNIPGGLPAELRRANKGPYPDEVVYETRPICFLQAADLLQETMAAADEHNPYLKVISSERECNRFTKYMQGHTPREHKDMIDSKEQHKWQAEQREKERQWQVDQKWSDRKWHLLMVLLAAAFTVLGWFIGRR